MQTFWRRAQSRQAKVPPYPAVPARSQSPLRDSSSAYRTRFTTLGRTVMASLAFPEELPFSFVSPFSFILFYFFISSLISIVYAYIFEPEYLQSSSFFPETQPLLQLCPSPLQKE